MWRTNQGEGQVLRRAVATGYGMTYGLENTSSAVGVGEPLLCLGEDCGTGVECYKVRTGPGEEGLVPMRDLTERVLPEPALRPDLANPVILALLLGTTRPECALAKLRGQQHLLEHILGLVYQAWAGMVSWEHQAVYKVADVAFPPAEGISVNMMPFRLHDPDSLPEHCRQYLPLIKACSPLASSDGAIAYLTVDEGQVEQGASQRRPGVHTDKSVLCKSGGCKERNTYWTHAWGMGRVTKGMFEGGIFMASTVSNSCQVWDCQVPQPGLLGDVEFLKQQLGEPIPLQQNELFWITDETPHESLPLARSETRQFFRLVVGEIGAWFSKHSDANPLGVLPPEGTQIIDEDKFEMCHDELEGIYTANRVEAAWQSEHELSASDY